MPSLRRPPALSADPSGGEPIHSLTTKITTVCTRLLWLVALLNAPSVFGVEVALVTPAGEVRAGSSVQVDLLVTNPGNEPATFTLTPHLDGRLTKDTQTWLVNLQSNTGDIAVPAGGFVRVPFYFLLPPDAAGQTVLELNQPAFLRGVIEIANLAPTNQTIPPVTPGELAGARPALPAASRLKRYYADHFTGHEPMYFVFGGEKPAAKFQFSLKYRILNDRGPLATRFPSLRGLNVAYTQRSLWDITSDSSPFYDTSYMPEFLFESLAADTGNHRGFTWLGYQAGLQHESNGRGDKDSRSMNIFYFRPMFVFGDPDTWRLILRPKFFFYVGSNSDNASIKKFRGYSELRAIFGKNNRLSISLTGRVGERFDKGSVQLDVSYPTEFLTGNFAVYLLAQYWNGYGESLLHYDERSSTFRAGFSLAR